MDYFNDFDKLVEWLISCSPDEEWTKAEWAEYSQLTPAHLELLASQFGTKDGYVYEVWYLADHGDHFSLSDWGMRDEVGVQRTERALGIQVYNTQEIGRVDYCYVFVKAETTYIGIEAMRKAVL